MKSAAPSAISVIGFVFVVLVVAVLWIRAVIGTRMRPRAAWGRGSVRRLESWS